MRNRGLVFLGLLFGLVLTAKISAANLKTDALKRLRFVCSVNGSVVLKKEGGLIRVKSGREFEKFDLFDQDLIGNIGELPPARFNAGRKHFSFWAEGSWKYMDHIDYPNEILITGTRLPENDERAFWIVNVNLISHYADTALETETWFCDSFRWNR